MSENLNLNLRNCSKAEVLVWLRDRAKSFYVEDMMVFTEYNWRKEHSGLVNQIRQRFYPKKVIVRSSAVGEDGINNSYAGCFHSELNVETSENKITSAIEKVFASYAKLGYAFDRNQILVQRQTDNIKMSGVVFTRQMETNAPYYVINYDERSGKTNTVTAGMEANVLYVSHFAKSASDKKWQGLLKAVREIEQYFPNQILDIEFGITKDNRVVIFQVRPLAANSKVNLPDDKFIQHLIEDMAQKFKRFSRRVPHLAGRQTVLGDMPDWNPSEIIGSRPNTLDYTLYSFIVTDEVWHEARTSLGYYDVYPAELMLSFGKKPYIDARISFNSFTPAQISRSLREKLVNYYLEKLKTNPAFQDKVEFAILWTCYDFSTSRELKALREFGFTKPQINQFLTALKELTNRILRDYPSVTHDDLQGVKFLTERRNMIMQFYKKQARSPWNSLYTAYDILQNCKKFGTFAFSRQARLAFIAKSLLISLRGEGVISEELYHDFLNSIRTVASQFNDDFYLFQNNKLDKAVFLKKYGHLRAGTYDITAPRYDSSPYLFSKDGHFQGDKRPVGRFSLEGKTLRGINKIMKQHGVCGDGRYLLGFIKSALENREYTKFEFTKSLSDALELIAEAGKILGFERRELCHADLATLMKFRNPEHGDLGYAQKIIRQSIERHQQERTWYDTVILPPLIVSERDFYYVSPYKAMPNFITTKSVQAEVLLFDEIKEMKAPSLTERIILLENADPGFDWIFTKKPLGIITKYGGVASHMSIRCAEFGIPAAIGCGEIIYNRLKNTKSVRLDCGKRIIRPLSEL